MKLASIKNDETSVSIMDENIGMKSNTLSVPKTKSNCETLSASSKISNVTCAPQPPTLPIIELIAVKEEPVDVVPSLYSCEVCLFSSFDLDKHQQHLLEVHPDFKQQYEFQNCKETLNPTPEQLVENQSSQSIDKQGIGKQFSKSCDGVPKAVLSKIKEEASKANKLKKFVEKDVKTDPYKCSSCSKQCFDEESLKKHRKSSHKDSKSKQYHSKIFYCNICNTKFITKHLVRQHIKGVHYGIRPFSCDVCGKDFSEKSNLAKHISIVHQQERKYECGLCWTKFGLKQALLQHIKCFHEKERPFECTECGKRFGTKKDLKRHHWNVHEQVKPFECEDCGRKFSRSYNLKLHSNVHKKIIKRKKKV